MYFIDSVGAFSIVVANIIFWLLILRRHFWSEQVRAYFLWTFFITMWSFGYGITLGGFFSYKITLAWNKYCQAMATLIGPHFFYFASTVIGREKQYNKFFKFYLFWGIINAIALFFTPYYVQGLWAFSTYKYQPLGGPLYILFVSFFVLCTIHGFTIALINSRKLVGVRKKHAVLFLWASGIGYSGGFTLFLQGLGYSI